MLGSGYIVRVDPCRMLLVCFGNLFFQVRPLPPTRWVEAVAWALRRECRDPNISGVSWALGLCSAMRTAFDCLG